MSSYQVMTIRRGRDARSAPPPAPGRRERRRAETREKLYRTAMGLFARHGYAQTTTEDITEAADVGQGTFFNYFPTKSHVLVMLTEKQLEKVTAAVAQAETGESSVLEVFRTLIHALVQELGRSQPLARSMLAAFVAQDEVRTLIADMLTHGRDLIGRICVIGQERGEIRRDLRAAELAITFQRGLYGTLLLWALQSRGDLPTWLEKALADFWSIAKAGKR